MCDINMQVALHSDCFDCGHIGAFIDIYLNFTNNCKLLKVADNIAS